jgi:heptosyltransferase-1
MRRILIVKVSSLGDVVHNMPLVYDLKARWPDCAIDWVVEEGYVELVRLVPGVDRIIPFALRRWRKQLTRVAAWRELAAFRRLLKAETYDAVIDSQGLLKTAVVAGWARRTRHAQVIGLANATEGSGYEPASRWFYTRSVSVPKRTHAVTRSRLLGAALTERVLETTPQFFGPAAQQLHANDPLWHDLPERFVIGFHATAGARKRWPVASWHALGQRLHADGLCMVLPWGSDAERAEAEALAAGIPNARVLPRFSLLQAFGLIQRAKLIVGVDTGLVHIAAALARPTVEIYTATGRWKTEGFWSPCIANVGDQGVIPDVETVYAASTRVMQECEA